MYKENKLAEQEWQTIVTMKKLLLVNSSLLLEF